MRYRARRAFPKILYRVWIPVALAACLMTASFSGAQEDQAEIPVGVRRPAKKKDAGPRAVAVLRLAGDGKVSLVPIAILINGKFWDATAYKADPVPMALEPGTVYEGERAGSSVGLFTVGSALHSDAKNVPNPWLGTGAWSPSGSEKPPAQVVAKAEGTPIGIDNSDAPPRLTKDPARVHIPGDSSGPGSGSSSGTTSGPASTNSPSGGSSSAGPSSSQSQPASGDGPPRLKKPAEDQSPSSSPTATAPTSGSGPGSSSSSGDGPPRLSKPAETQSDTKKTDAAPDAKSGDPKSGDPKSGGPKPSTPSDSDAVAVSDSGADEANRPRLRRAKPAHAFSDDDFPGYSRPGKNSSAASGKIVAVAAATGPMQLIPAISDAGGPEPHSYSFEWLKDEEGERRQQVMDLARQELRAYAMAQAKAQILATTSPAGRRKTTTKPPEPKFGAVQMVAYDLWTNNQPVIVFSAKAQIPPAGAKQASSDDPEYSILLVTYPDIYNNLHKIYSAVTDQRHLDITPRFELIDAVDADGDGRGELLFQETTDQGKGWVIFRASADTLWKMFDSLNPE